MVLKRPQLPMGHGELLARPDYSEWGDLIAENRRSAAQWDFTVAGMHVSEMRRVARLAFVMDAEEFSARIGVPTRAGGDPEAPIVATGHQPELYHPGVWVKDFLLQRLSEESGASAVDVVVDSDGFDTVAVTSPCMTPGVERCKQYLAIGTPDSCYAFAPVPSPADLDVFCESSDEMLASLSAPAIRRHFRAFCEELRSASKDATSLAELVTFARRRYEVSAGTDYLELPVTRMSRGEGWLHFVGELAFRAEEFATAYNAELAEYRAIHKTRSAAQPFPDLRLDGDVELPLWVLSRARRTPVFARRRGDEVLLVSEGAEIISLGTDVCSSADALEGADFIVAPKALALTLYVRTFCCDLFIHGVGGGRYDRVTDGLIRRYWGVEPPAFTVASMTMFLPLGVHVVTEEEVSDARERLNRLTHNPDALLAEVEFESSDEQARAAALATEKSSLVVRIAQPDADKKALGLRIREVNSELSAIIAPLRSQWEAELASLESQLAASEILTDRTYPFCFWAPVEVADKVR